MAPVTTFSHINGLRKMSTSEVKPRWDDTFEGFLAVKIGEPRFKDVDLRRREQIIKEEFAALTRRSMPVGDYLTPETALRLHLARRGRR